MITDFSGKELQVEQRKSLLDNFFGTLDSKALAITTSQPFLFVKAAEASLTPMTAAPQITVSEEPPASHPEPTVKEVFGENKSALNRINLHNGAAATRKGIH